MEGFSSAKIEDMASLQSNLFIDVKWVSQVKIIMYNIPISILGFPVMPLHMKKHDSVLVLGL
jgi:hypothetical protein